MVFILSVLDRNHGDFTHKWNPDNADEVKNAREMFENLKKTGYLIYETAKDAEGKVSHQAVHKFDALQGAYDFEEPRKKEDRQLTATPAAAGG